MKVSTFFKILNRKIEQYDKLASNPFEQPQPIVLIWIEDIENEKNEDFKPNK